MLITAPSVVNDPSRTFDPCDTDGDQITGNVNGAWSFKTLMGHMANEQDTGISPQEFIHNWLQNWLNEPVVNSYPIKSSPAITGYFPGWDGQNPATLDMNNLPFRLLAIANRIDLAKPPNYGAASSGEIRFVFGLVKNNQDCSSGKITVILEYKIPANSCNDLKGQAQMWYALDEIENISRYKNALENITNQVTLANAMLSRPNGSAISLVRTNDLEFFSGGANDVHQMREFTLDAVSNNLVSTDLKQAPQYPEMDLTSPYLADYMEENANLLLCSSHTIPLTYNNASFRASSHVFQDFNYWVVPPPSLENIPQEFPGCYQSESIAELDPSEAHMKAEIRQKLSLNTCNGCHRGETGTDTFHISPTSPGIAQISGFFTGVFVEEPVDQSVDRYYHDLARRELVMENLLSGSCLLQVAPPSPH